MEDTESCEADSTEGIYVDADHTGEEEATVVCKPQSAILWEPIKPESVESWENKYWNKLDGAMHKLLTLTPDQYKPLSYEELYTCVYKSVCLGFQEPLCDHLCQLVRKHLEAMADTLERCSSEDYLVVAHANFTQYLRALKGIVPIFSYMDRFHVALKMKTELEVVLLNLFCETVVEKNLQKLLGVLRKCLTSAFQVSPPVAASLIKQIYDINNKYASADPELFAKYLPNILPPTSVNDLPSMVHHTRQMQVEMLTSGVERGDQSRKRPSEHDYDHLDKDPGY